MSVRFKNQLQISRTKAGYTQNQIAEDVTAYLQMSDSRRELSTRQYAKYESIGEKVYPPADVMAILIKLYGDKKLGYDYLIATNPVARMLLPSGVERKNHLLEVVMSVQLATAKFMTISAPLIEATLDNSINGKEQEVWDEFTIICDEMDRASFEGKCMSINIKEPNHGTR